MSKCSTQPDELKSRQITLWLLGFDQRGFTNDVLNAVRLDGLTWFQAIRLDSNGLLSEGYIRFRIDCLETVTMIIQRLKAITGLIQITPRFS